jgi:hypothetical protein
MAARQLINVNGSGGAFVSVSASIFSLYVEIQEDGSVTAQGLDVKYPSDNFTATYDYLPTAQPIKLGVPLNTGQPGRAPLLGKPSRPVPVPKSDATLRGESDPGD